MNQEKKFLIILFLFIQSLTAAQVPDSTFIKEIDSLLTDEIFTPAQKAIIVYDLTAEKTLYSKNGKLLFHPASTQKILTTSSALLFLDDYKFKTTVYYDGEIDDSICSGNLYIAGGFDPDFTSNDLDSVAKEIKQYGIKEIKGNLYADVSMMDSLFWGEGWMWDDDPNLFAAYLSPLSINDNGIQIIVEPDTVNQKVIVRTIPETKFVEIENKLSLAEKDSSDFKIERDWLSRSNKITANGFISKKEKPDTTAVSIFNPSLYFITLFNEALSKNGITIKGETGFKKLNEDAEDIFTFEREIDSVLINTNKNSDNLSAEMILRATSFEYFGAPSSAKEGIKLVDSLITLTGFNPKNFRIVDGSGLSFYNLISAELLTSVLKYFYYNEPELFVKLYNSFPVAGYDGSLQNRMREGNSFRKVHAKTGTISGASNLAGYMSTKNNHLIAFTIFIQNYTGGAQKARNIQDKICETIYNNN
ncbi:MAG: D-alanyl-D-alanine carboxypeptidase/D-alanyl-D-alanine-endopeptidase [Ignavibacteriales bacterium]|nr:D-alanyl-D-alanine carboxypeptidase/D-alanyl-D-alanine-endopeptidase [Ignavibacteriales bacterium]